jgi:hypothetical protein
MSRRFLPLLCAGVFALAGLTLAAEDPPAGQDEPPLRLKKKKPAEGPPKVEPGKGEPGKPAKAAQKQELPKAEEKEPEQPEQPEIDEKEVLARITKNMRAVEEKLAKGEITDGTRQTQDDILKDIELLLEQNRRGGGGGAGNENQQQNQDQNQQNQEQNGQQNKGGSGGNNKSNGGKQQSGSAGQSSSKGGSAGKSSGGMSRRQARAERRRQERLARAGKQGKRPGGKKPGDGQDKNLANNQGSSNQGGGGGTSTGPINRNADLNKTGVWGHLPAALRPDMNAYSNPQPFMPRYDDLIKKYYRTIAEQGRRKGD